MGVRAATGVRLARPISGVVPASVPFFFYRYSVGCIEGSSIHSQTPTIMLRQPHHFLHSTFVRAGASDHPATVIHSAVIQKSRIHDDRSGRAQRSRVLSQGFSASLNLRCGPFFSIQIPDGMVRQLPLIGDKEPCCRSARLRGRFWPHQSAPSRRTVAACPYRTGRPEPPRPFHVAGAAARAVSVSFYNGGFCGCDSRKAEKVNLNKACRDRRFFTQPEPDSRAFQSKESYKTNSGCLLRHFYITAIPRPHREEMTVYM